MQLPSTLRWMFLLICSPYKLKMPNQLYDFSSPCKKLRFPGQELLIGIGICQLLRGRLQQPPLTTSYVIWIFKDLQSMTSSALLDRSEEFFQLISDEVKLQACVLNWASGDKWDGGKTGKSFLFLAVGRRFPRSSMSWS